MKRLRVTSFFILLGVIIMMALPERGGAQTSSDYEYVMTLNDNIDEMIDASYFCSVIREPDGPFVFYCDDFVNQQMTAEDLVVAPASGTGYTLSLGGYTAYLGSAFHERGLLPMDCDFIAHRAQREGTSTIIAPVFAIPSTPTFRRDRSTFICQYYRPYSNSNGGGEAMNATGGNRRGARQ